MSKHIKTQHGHSLLAAGYSLIVVDEQKRPLHKWKEQQTTALTTDQLDTLSANPNAWRYGYATGYNDLFTVDLDLKVLPTESRKAFFDEFMAFVRDQIPHFDSRVAVYRTVNQGYHCTYRTKTDMGNEKLAVPVNSGIKKDGRPTVEALIETRGAGGYCIVYDDCVNDTPYQRIGYLDEEEHQTMIAICRMWDERAEESERPEPVKSKTEYKQTGVTPWQDYNERHDVFDVVGDEFKIIRHLSTKTVIKRHGATSAHSGYVFKDSGCMYLFSTGTQYPHQKLLSPFALYAHRYNGGDMSAAAKALYAQGYGDRMKAEVPAVLSVVKSEPITKQSFPLDVFPTSIQNYVTECNKTLGHNVDFMGASLIWLMSVIIGNSLKVTVKKGWNECVVTWLAVVGRAGVGKTPAISMILKPLVELNSREIREYRRQKERFEAYEKASKEEKANIAEVRKPRRSQFIVNDVTIEALVELHEENPNAVGVFKDELAGWIKDMNKYRAGGDLEFHLSAFSNSPAYTTRKTVRDNYIHSPIIPVLGGIQPAVLNQVFTDEYRDNGFSDRLLLCYPDCEVEKWNENELSDELLQWYSDYILSLFAYVKSDIVQVDEEGDVKSRYIAFDKDARVELARIMDKITDRQNSEDEAEGTKSILPKQKTYLPRFSILLHVLECWDNAEVLTSDITKETVLKAERLVDYFITMAERVVADTYEYNKMKASAGDKPTKTEAERFQSMFAANPNLKRTEAAKLLKVSRSQIYNWIREIEQAKK
jgi:hypothetical protein